VRNKSANVGRKIGPNLGTPICRNRLRTGISTSPRNENTQHGGNWGEYVDERVWRWISMRKDKILI
jgi:hypothetical protein